MGGGDGDVKERRRVEKAVGRSGVVVVGNGKLTDVCCWYCCWYCCCWYCCCGL